MTDNLFDILCGIERMTAEPVRETYIRAPFGWPGGKWQSLKYIVPLLPRAKTFVDGCGGSGIVTINSPDYYDLKVFNDRHAGVVAFYRCLRDNEKQEALVSKLQLMPHAREEFVWAHDSWDKCDDDVERAARWYYMLRVSFAQLGRNFGRSTNSTNMIARKLHSALEDFYKFHLIFRNVQIENLDVCQCIMDYDSSETVFYIDPDYIGTDPGIYKHGVNHVELMECIQNSKGWFAVSGYDNELYNSYSWDEKKQWNVSCAMISQAFNDSSNLQDKRDVMGRDRKAQETLWIKEFR